MENNQDYTEYQGQEEQQEVTEQGPSGLKALMLWISNYPVTAIIIGVSILLFIFVRIVSFKYGLGRSFLFFGARLNVIDSHIDIWNGELWRLFLNLFHHGNLMHIVFNLFWFYYFGTLSERYLKSSRYIVFFILCGIFQIVLCELTFEQGAIGLSGVIYGMFGFLIMVRDKDPLLQSLITNSLIKAMVILLFVSIGITLLGIMNIANVGHFSGFSFGLFYGFCLYKKPFIFNKILFSLVILLMIPGLYYIYRPVNDPLWQEWRKYEQQKPGVQINQTPESNVKI